MDFPKPVGPRPGTLLAGYKPKGVLLRLFPSNVATMLLRPMAQHGCRCCAALGQDNGKCSFFSLARLAQLCSSLVEAGHQSHAPQSSQLPLEDSKSSSLSHAVWLHNLHHSQSAVPALVPLHSGWHFASQISLPGLQLVASIHALQSHDTRGS